MKAQDRCDDGRHARLLVAEQKADLVRDHGNVAHRGGVEVFGRGGDGSDVIGWLREDPLDRCSIPEFVRYTGEEPLSLLILEGRSRGRDLLPQECGAQVIEILGRARD